jgi:rhodanese-related sulfurtransferase
MMEDSCAFTPIHGICRSISKLDWPESSSSMLARDAYAGGRIPGAISFPHREMSIETTATLDRSLVYVVYCDGIGCNASTKGAYKLARLGFRTKELLGGLDWWRRDGHAVVASSEPGSLLAAAE